MALANLALTVFVKKEGGLTQSTGYARVPRRKK
ncbi:MAG: hypothetical protein KatS3mg111_0151 [Pirellulaceae bacterium]|nr:MAG: hypothetical protein KatS3mg111_0151 [Pirellulaceae bacterium]